MPVTGLMKFSLVVQKLNFGTSRKAHALYGDLISPPSILENGSYTFRSGVQSLDLFASKFVQRSSG
jgi:hypothetical protein